jgi:hypothetical protein
MSTEKRSGKTLRFSQTAPIYAIEKVFGSMFEVLKALIELGGNLD